MGFFDNGNKIYSPKYITAEITDANNNIHFFPITNTFDDFFVVEINKQLYAFTIKNARILRYKQKLVRSFGVIQYDTCNFSPIKPEIKELELILKENSLKKVDMKLFKILRIMANREKENFEPHDINKLIAEFEKDYGGEYPEKVHEIKTFLGELGIRQIVTPLRRVTDFIQDDLLATSPNFLASVVPKLESVDMEHKKITNTEIKGNKNLMKYLLIAMIGVAIIAAIYIAYDNGAFDSLLNLGDSLSSVGSSFQGLPSPTGGFTPSAQGDPYSDANIQKKYTPETLAEAINRGEVDYNRLSENMKGVVDRVKEAVMP